MPTALSLRTARCRFTEALAALITFATARGYEVALDEGKVPAVGSKHMPGSLHELGLAQDLILYLGAVYLTDSEDYVMLGTYWEEYGVEHGLPLVWGGNWKAPDGNHFSLRWGGKA